MNLFHPIDKYGDQIAVHAERGYSYAEMLDVADTICDEIDERTLVFCLCANDKESLFGYVGFIRGRVVPVLLDASIPDEQLQKLIRLYKPTYIWAKSTHDVLSTEMNGSFMYGDYTLFKCPEQIQHDLHEQLALLLTTSGSTGSPKFVRLSYDNLLQNAESIAQYLNIDQHDRPITTLPMNYSYGLSIINSHVLSGATIILTDKSFMQKAFWDLCKAQRVTTFGGVPFHYEMLNRLKFETFDLPSLKTLTQAGGKLSPSLTEKFATLCKQKGVRFFTMYGQTEATARMSYLPHEKSLEKLGSIGVAIPGGKLTVRGDMGEEITTPHVVGELIYNGANVSLGYAESLPDLANGDENDGLLHTGDMAYFDEEGYFFIVGRIKRMIKMHGSRISLEEVEALLAVNGHDCVCSGVDDRMYIYTLQDDCALIKQIIKKNLNVRGVKVMKIDSIPRNHFGKILYSELPREELVTV